MDWFTGFVLLALAVLILALMFTALAYTARRDPIKAGGFDADLRAAWQAQRAIYCFDWRAECKALREALAKKELPL
jgi:hypothetical protein